jgi:hypothetical protein
LKTPRRTAKSNFPNRETKTPVEHAGCMMMVDYGISISRRNLW